MPDLLVAALLLLPVAALFFLSRKLTRRIVYPHELIEEAKRRGPASTLLRFFRFHYDALFDAAIAIVVALALAEAHGTLRLFERPKAAVIDCSASMLRGRRGDRPLDRALARLESDKGLEGARAFALAFDPGSATTRLYRLEAVTKGSEGESAALRLEDGLCFFDVDYGRLAELRKKGYGEMTLVTDRFAQRPAGFSVIETETDDASSETYNAYNEPYSAWPASARYDRRSGSYAVTFAQAGRGPGLSVSVMEGSGGRFEPLDRAAYRVASRQSGFDVLFARPGLYRIDLDEAWSGFHQGFGIRLLNARVAGSASGEFSRRMMSVFPLVEEAPRPDFVFADKGQEPPSAREAKVVSTELLAASPAFHIPPRFSGGRPILGSLGLSPAAAEFSLGPEATANEDLPLAYDGLILSELPPPFLTAPRADDRKVAEMGGILFVKDAEGLLPLNPPSTEFFPGQAGSLLALPPARNPSAFTVLALFALAAGKLLAFRRLSGKSLFFRG